MDNLLKVDRMKIANLIGPRYAVHKRKLHNNKFNNFRPFRVPAKSLD